MNVSWPLLIFSRRHNGSRFCNHCHIYVRNQVSVVSIIFFSPTPIDSENYVVVVTSCCKHRDVTSRRIQMKEVAFLRHTIAFFAVPHISLSQEFFCEVQTCLLMHLLPLNTKRQTGSGLNPMAGSDLDEKRISRNSSR